MTRKSQHYWQIHRRVCHNIWTKLEETTRHIIASDTNHETYEYRSFERGVNMEAERLYNDPEFFMNDQYSFKVSQFEPV